MCPAGGLVDQNSVYGARIADGTVGRFKFVRVVGVSYYFWFGGKPS